MHRLSSASRPPCTAVAMILLIYSYLWNYDLELKEKEETVFSLYWKIVIYMQQPTKFMLKLSYSRLSQ